MSWTAAGRRSHCFSPCAPCVRAYRDERWACTRPVRLNFIIIKSLAWRGSLQEFLKSKNHFAESSEKAIFRRRRMLVIIFRFGKRKYLKKVACTCTLVCPATISGHVFDRQCFDSAFRLQLLTSNFWLQRLASIFSFNLWLQFCGLAVWLRMFGCAFNLATYSW